MDIDNRWFKSPDVRGDGVLDLYYCIGSNVLIRHFKDTGLLQFYSSPILTEKCGMQNCVIVEEILDMFNRHELRFETVKAAKAAWKLAISYSCLPTVDKFLEIPGVCSNACRV